MRGEGLLSSCTPIAYRVGGPVAWVLPRGYTALYHKASGDILCHICKHSEVQTPIPLKILVRAINEVPMILCMECCDAEADLGQVRGGL